MYLMVENSGTCDAEAVTLLGVTSSRNHEDTRIVGCFGSGFKHSINTFLRKNINPIIFLGKEKICFYTKPLNIKTLDGNTKHLQVCAIITKEDGTVQNKDLGFVLSFGQLDWGTSEEMALREVISNSIDASFKTNSDISDVNIDVVTTCEGRDNKTRVFIPFTTEIQKCYNELNVLFLHFSGHKFDKPVLEKLGNNRIKDNFGPVIYRKGVLVGELESKKSLFDYNIDNIEIDESRNIQKYSAKTKIAYVLSNSDVETFQKILGSLDDEYLEHEVEVDYWFHYYEGIRPPLKQAFQNLYGGKTVIVPSICPPQFLSKLDNKHIPFKIIKQTKWYDALMYSGIKTWTDCLTESEKRNRVFQEPDSKLRQRVRQLWSVFEQVDMTFGKEWPSITVFDEVSDGGEEKLGYADNIGIYIRKDLLGDNSLLDQTIMEELIHYVSGAKDYTRDFQNFTIKLLIKHLNGL